MRSQTDRAFTGAVKGG